MRSHSSPDVVFYRSENPSNSILTDARTTAASIVRFKRQWEQRRIPGSFCQLASSKLGSLQRQILSELDPKL